MSVEAADASENGFGHVELLPEVKDDHGGVIVEMKDPMDSVAFVAALRTSLLLWKRQGIKGVWIKLPIGLVNLVEATVKEGFWYHHAEPTYLMLVYWIPGTASTIPENASHQLSVGAIVLNDKREILVVKEKIGRFQRAGVWKIPTGVVDEGEDICAAAIREVKEETGKQDLEIEAAQWMPLEEYAAQPFAQKVEFFRYITDLCMAKVNRGYAGFSPRLTKSVFRDDLGHLYLNNKDLY